MPTVCIGNHLSYFHDIPALFPFALYVLLELLRSHTSPLVQKTVRFMQPPLAFIGILISWFFVFAILTVYVLRIRDKEIPSPFSLHWLKQSFVFCIPLLLAMAFWTYQIFYHVRYIAQTDLSSATVSGFRTDLWTNILFRTGVLDGLSSLPSNIVQMFVVNVNNGYGLFGLAMLYIASYSAIRSRKNDVIGSSSVAVKMFCLFLIPCIMHYLFFSQNCSLHPHTSILLSPALSASFVFAPIFVLQIMRKSHLIPAMVIRNKTITVATILGLSFSCLYAVSQHYGRRSVTKFFTPMALYHVTIANFLKENTAYHDVIFFQRLPCKCSSSQSSYILLS